MAFLYQVDQLAQSEEKNGRHLKQVRPGIFIRQIFTDNFGNSPQNPDCPHRGFPATIALPSCYHVAANTLRFAGCCGLASG